MAKYYNTTRGPLAVSLSSGKALTISPKTWVEIDPADEGSSALVALKRKGYMKRSVLEDEAPASEPVPAPPAIVVTAPVVVPMPSITMPVQPVADKAADPK